jgi:tRNA/tmRNA/rRNA uracil-C5-methylase (TrmA/RlmC/RlmD family)
VVAIEINRDALKRGEADAVRLGASNIRFRQDDVRVFERFLPADLVALDPPRAGLSPETTALLIAAKPQQILYISCDPATWARDVRKLVDGGYALQFARPYDFYPFTHHVEVLSLLSKT